MKLFKRKSINIAVISVFALLVIYALFVLFSSIGDNTSGRMPVNIYFFNPTTSTIEPERHYITFGSNAIMAQNVFNALFAGPQSSELVNVIPDSITALNASIINDVIFQIEFSSEYLELDPVEEMIFRGSLVWTMTELSFISDVNFFVDGMELLTATGNAVGFMNRSNVIIGGWIPAAPVDSKWVSLYFKDESEDWLIVERRFIQAVDRSVEFEIISEILKGPINSVLLPTVSPDVILIDATVVNYICYVSLSANFLPGPGARTGDFALSVYSIVNSLTYPELDNDIQGVQFLIESEQVTEIHDGLDLANPFTRNESIILR